MADVKPKLKKIETRSDVINALASYEVLVDGVAVAVVTSSRYETQKLQRNGRMRKRENVAWEAEMTNSFALQHLGYETRADAVADVMEQVRQAAVTP